MLRRKKRYYREWLSQHGWGVMISYDTVMARTKRESKTPVAGMYDPDKSFEFIMKVPKKHLHMTDEELSKIYGHKET
jgi:hypothetical protein